METNASTPTLILIVTFLFAANSWALEIPRPPIEAQQAADSGKAILKNLVQNDNQIAYVLGFQSPEELTDATLELGRAIPVIIVPVESLTSDISPFLQEANQFVYPILVNNRVRSAISVRKEKVRKEEPTAREAERWNHAFGATGGPLAAEELNILDSAFIIRISKINVLYLGTLKENEVSLYRLKVNAVSERSIKDRKISIGPQENAGDALPKLSEEVGDQADSTYSSRRRHTH